MDSHWILILVCFLAPSPSQAADVSVYVESSNHLPKT